MMVPFLEDCLSDRTNSNQAIHKGTLFETTTKDVKPSRNDSADTSASQILVESNARPQLSACMSPLLDLQSRLSSAEGISLSRAPSSLDVQAAGAALDMDSSNPPMDIDLLQLPFPDSSGEFRFSQSWSSADPLLDHAIQLFPSEITTKMCSRQEEDAVDDQKYQTRYSDQNSSFGNGASFSLDAQPSNISSLPYMSLSDNLNDVSLSLGCDSKLGSAGSRSQQLLQKDCSTSGFGSSNSTIHAGRSVDRTPMTSNKRSVSEGVTLSPSNAKRMCPASSSDTGECDPSHSSLVEIRRIGGELTAMQYIPSRARLASSPHDNISCTNPSFPLPIATSVSSVTLNGSNRLKIRFISLGVPGEHPQHFGKKRYRIPDGLSGMHQVYNQHWKFEVRHGPRDNGITSITWSVTNLSSGSNVTRTETLQEAFLREYKGQTICNQLLKDALEMRAKELEQSIQDFKDKPIKVANIRSCVKVLRPKKCIMGLLFFGLLHECVQDNLRKLDSDCCGESDCSSSCGSS
jgi:hypothetical protein